MARFEGNRLLLTEAEAQQFSYEIAHPEEEVTARRREFLNTVRNLRVTHHEDGSDEVEFSPKRRGGPVVCRTSEIQTDTSIANVFENKKNNAYNSESVAQHYPLIAA